MHPLLPGPPLVSLPQVFIQHFRCKHRLSKTHPRQSDHCSRFRYSPAEVQHLTPTACAAVNKKLIVIPNSSATGSGHPWLTAASVWMSGCLIQSKPCKGSHGMLSTFSWTVIFAVELGSSASGLQLNGFGASVVVGFRAFFQVFSIPRPVLTVTFGKDSWPA